MLNKSTFTLINPENGNLALKVFSFEDNSYFDHVQRLNYYSLIWIQTGSGKVSVDFSEYNFVPNHLLSFSPYQPFMLENTEKITGVALCFHPDFFCIHHHQKEVACNGVLFNNIYQPPFVEVDADSQKIFDILLTQLKSEMQNPALAQNELLISYIKIFLITASRLRKVQFTELEQTCLAQKEPFILQNLKNFIELHYKTKHSASDYADLLNITPKALAKITRVHFNKTLTNLIAERIIIEAKRELYLTNKSVKEIAYELGYEDEHYFSRFFKNNASVSPQLYRETVGSARMMQ